jgi:ATP-dependent Clp protease ATP-binding subunit ClpA
MREQMTDTLRLALHLACVEARGHKQEFVGTEHVLLGLLEANHSDFAARSIDTRSMRSM